MVDRDLPSMAPPRPPSEPTSTRPPPPRVSDRIASSQPPTLRTLRATSTRTSLKPSDTGLPRAGAFIGGAQMAIAQRGYIATFAGTNDYAAAAASGGLTT